MSLATFEEAIQQSDQFERRHLLLGNGFSIALFRTIFSYPSLFDQATTLSPKLQRIFEILETTDFEYVIRRLAETSGIVGEYVGDAEKIQGKLSRDANKVRASLVHAISNNHPPNPGTISAVQFTACRRFLKHFVGNRNDGGCIYSVNYDLLLYWTLMHSDEHNLHVDDGFRPVPPDDTLTWIEEKAFISQNIYYLHGALHIRELGNATQKIRSVPDRPILAQVTELIQENEFPLFVTEGRFRQKRRRIGRSPYLDRSYLRFTEDMGREDACLFIFGHSLADHDQHILSRIVSGNVRHLFVGIYDDPTSAGSSDAEEVIARAKALVKSRRPGKRLDFTPYDARSAEVWGTT